MRHVFKKHSTKPERIFYEVLKQLHISFKHRWIINGTEVDFVINNLAIEIDGHEQNIEKNNFLLKHGYTPIHLHNSEINPDTIKQLLINYNAYKITT